MRCPTMMENGIQSMLKSSYRTLQAFESTTSCIVHMRPNHGQPKIFDICSSSLLISSTGTISDLSSTREKDRTYFLFDQDALNTQAGANQRGPPQCSSDRLLLYAQIH